MEIERKFLVKKLPELSNLSSSRITQAYVSLSPEVRVRKRDSEYYLTEKGEGTLVREENERKISKKEALKLFIKAKDRKLKKTRYLVPIDAYTAELDIYDDIYEIPSVVEVEFESVEDAKAFVIPDWFGEEITEKKEYRNKSIAKRCADIIKRERKLDLIHLAIILLGTLFVLSGAFYNAYWFDEAYSVGLVNHSLWDIIKIAPHDVHPLLYYIMLKIYTLIFGVSAYAMRIFSVIATFAISLIGLTHIKKDFGRKVGMYYSGIIFLFPVVFKYSQQIRMYTWAALFVALCAIYAYRYIKSPNRKNQILFITFSVMCAYTHHFALFTTVFINIFMFVYCFMKKQIVKRWIVPAVWQIALFIPGIFVFLVQALRGGAGWITLDGDILSRLFAFFYVGDALNNAVELPQRLYALLAIIGLAIFIFVAFVLYKEYEKKNTQAYAPIMAFSIFVTVILATFIYSFIKPLLYERYLFVMIALFALALAYALSKVKIKCIPIAIIAIMSVILIVRVVPVYQATLNESSDSVMEYANENIGKDDLLLFDDNSLSAYSFAVYSHETTCCAYNPDNWGVEEAYKAFSKDSYVTKDTQKISELLKQGKKTVYVIVFENNEKSKTIIDTVEQSGLYTFERKDTVTQEYYDYYFDIYVYNLA
ncbi:MAG: glycosyltransferase family 39 protein [Clostridia bacterium]|nr:glycosyltransferase family 39 protein [Clostridia bacterium]